MSALLATGAIDGALAVALGAFGAHGLKKIATPEQLAIWRTACEYQFYHVFGILLVALLSLQPGLASVSIAGWLFLAGSVLFSGSLYLLVLAGTRWIGIITPLGGLVLIAGWLTLAWQSLA